MTSGRDFPDPPWFLHSFHISEVRGGTLFTPTSSLCTAYSYSNSSTSVIFPHKVLPEVLLVPENPSAAYHISASDSLLSSWAFCFPVPAEMCTPLMVIYMTLVSNSICVAPASNSNLAGCCTSSISCSGCWAPMICLEIQDSWCVYSDLMYHLVAFWVYQWLSKLFRVSV